MKKKIALVVAGMLLVGGVAAGCGTSDTPADGATASPTAEATTESQVSAEARADLNGARAELAGLIVNGGMAKALSEGKVDQGLTDALTSAMDKATTVNNDSLSALDKDDEYVASAVAEVKAATAELQTAMDAVTAAK
ncbi:MAG: hypothetical protein LBH13_08000 [Cellulomonadaceae bacterium]|jgi:hypothetical protein|nr:hypothetical protein [Cellulomonadaceae bacterium]